MPPAAASTETPSQRTPRFWLAAGVISINVLTSAFFSLRAVIDTSLSGTGLGHTASLYALARSLPLVAGVLGSITLGSRASLLGLGFTLALVQAFDATLGQSAIATWGPAALAVLTVAACAALWRQRC
jgi:hypothetical protein